MGHSSGSKRAEIMRIARCKNSSAAMATAGYAAA